ncbi:MAG TPA: hypothetical protein PK544_12555 [Spirochaetota bacterium]|nr:hypothetical protein [Spirochaetota bacterium]HPJ38095.1 hypothetical protein [Spirochaetota bacterium]HPQ54451.1 hypothetical protein [Spirochaetota bacterium]
MNQHDSIFKKLENITYLMELVRSEIEHATEDSFIDYKSESSERMEIKDITEEDGTTLEGFFIFLEEEEGLIVEFKDGTKVPLHSLETDNMYDLFVRIHSAILDETVSYS